RTGRSWRCHSYTHAGRTDRTVLSVSSFPQHLDQLRIGLRKFQIRQLPARDPAHLLTELRLRIAEQLAGEEMKLDTALRVGRRHAEHLLADPHLHVELLAQ